MSLFGYHYAPHKLVDTILKHGIIGREINPLFDGYNRRYPSYGIGVFLFTDPWPIEWAGVQNTVFPLAWKQLLATLQNRVALKVELTDKAFVLDAAYISLEFANRSDPKWKYYESKSQVDWLTAYWESKIPLKRFFEQRDMLNYALPEIVEPGERIDNTWLHRRITIAEQQPIRELGFCSFPSDLERIYARYGKETK